MRIISNLVIDRSDRNVCAINIVTAAVAGSVSSSPRSFIGSDRGVPILGVWNYPRLLNQDLALG